METKIIFWAEPIVNGNAANISKQLMLLSKRTQFVRYLWNKEIVKRSNHVFTTIHRVKNVKNSFLVGAKEMKTIFQLFETVSKNVPKNNLVIVKAVADLVLLVCCHLKLRLKIQIWKSLRLNVFSTEHTNSI